MMNSNFTAFIDEFTSSTYIMVISSDPAILPALTQTNIDLAKRYFEAVVRSSTTMDKSI